MSYTSQPLTLDHILNELRCVLRAHAHLLRLPERLRAHLGQHLVGDLARSLGHRLRRELSQP